MMKGVSLLIILSFVIGFVYGQENKKHYIGGHFSYGRANIDIEKFEINQPVYKDYKAKNYYTFSIDYAYRISKNTEFITGLSASLIKLDLTNTYSGSDRGPFTYDDSFGIFSIPIGLKYYFGKYFFANGGLSINYHPSKGYTWGLGGFAGLGALYTFKSGLSLSLAPEIKMHMVSIGGKENSTMSAFNDKILQLGFNIGIGYRF
ncbi:hypothetical protein JGH11_17300 [Dysgonomonas sp. Marseille-P4677]|uniref:hypothetical protein n=1 Tax=Dysgonomonas sp. Marseille-P4677 TaxID=2364790 RepID=UPI0019140950|nr:hypothetical protein [Dysgonomonas sp. Marseille-P4677]MBK5722634.1 hypothetical protein [Dysgonomonas sp. Marseille-P4677]